MLFLDHNNFWEHNFLVTLRISSINFHNANIDYFNPILILKPVWLKFTLALRIFNQPMVHCISDIFGMSNTLFLDTMQDHDFQLLNKQKL